ncbi:MAG: prepilin peptidase [Candidatus Diapherotrites archaeon]|nr:prepilin peptidase [Candidatus Diapherotrites archaeon]
MLDLFALRIGIVIIGSVLAAYTDYKKGLIYDSITLPMIGAGTLFNLLEQEFTGIWAGALVFAAGYLLYATGKIGGGDVKLFSAIALLLPFYKENVFILNVLLFSGLAGLTFVSVNYPLKYLRTTPIRNALEENKAGLAKSAMFAIAIAAYFFVLSSSGFVSTTYLLVFGAPMVFGLLFLAFEKGIREKIFLKKIQASELEEDEIIAREFLDKKTIEKLGLGLKGVIDGKARRKILELGLKEIPVYRNLPKFGPFILLGVIAALFAPPFIALAA